VKTKTKTSSTITVPQTVQHRAGFKLGDVLEFKASSGVITILPKLPTADDEYTPEQRRIIDAQLAEGLADIKAGRTAGPFNSLQYGYFCPTPRKGKIGFHSCEPSSSPSVMERRQKSSFR